MEAHGRPRHPAAMGRYRLQEKLGRGHSGETFRALDTAHDSLVALKLLSTNPSASDYRAKVARACGIVGRLRSRHVVTVLDHGVIDGQLFVTSSLVGGPDLGALVARRGALSPTRAVAVVEQVGSALQAAHALGLAHRDVKPTNVLLAPGDHVLLGDFGLMSPGGLSLDYAAPERFRGVPGDHREDVYALGCLLFSCLTGAKPFPAKTLPERMRRHLEDPAPRPSRSPGVPSGFDDVVATAMAKTPSERWSTVGALLGAARAALLVK